MAFTLEQLAHEAMQLPAASRAELAEKLVESLDFSSEEVRELWSIEAIRRRDDVRVGTVQCIPGEDVISEVRRIVGR